MHSYRFTQAVFVKHTIHCIHLNRTNRQTYKRATSRLFFDHNRGIMLFFRSYENNRVAFFPLKNALK